ncbi:hypothetical protein ACQR3P_30495 [Rhodococcus sp. IEGM1300]
MMTPGQILAAVLLAVAMGFGGAWKVQDWRYGEQLAQQTSLHQSDLASISNAAAAQMRADQDKRLALEQRLSTSDQIHHKELSDAQTKQARVRDSLATAELRLSVLLDATDSASGCDMPATPGTVGVAHAARRAQLDPAHAQRIIDITNTGDQGLIALAACQKYAKEISARK